MFKSSLCLKPQLGSVTTPIVNSYLKSRPVVLQIVTNNNLAPTHLVIGYYNSPKTRVSVSIGPVCAYTKQLSCAWDILLWPFLRLLWLVSLCRKMRHWLHMVAFLECSLCPLVVGSFLPPQWATSWRTSHFLIYMVPVAYVYFIMKAKWGVSSGFTLRVCQISCTADIMHTFYIIAHISNWSSNLVFLQTFYRHKNNIQH